MQRNPCLKYKQIDNGIAKLIWQSLRDRQITKFKSLSIFLLTRYSTNKKVNNKIQLSKRFEFKKEIWIAIKSKETSTYVASYAAGTSQEYQATYVTIIHAPACNCQLKHMQPNECTNKTFSSVSTSFILYIGWCYCLPAKVGIKSCRCTRECFICTFV